MAHLNEHAETWIGRTLMDASGHRIGKIGDVYTVDDTGQPEWLAVTSGLMGASIHFVPMRGATTSGGGVQVPFPKDQVKAAPSAGADGRLARMEKGRLYAHYGYSFAEERNRLQRSLGTDPSGLNGPADQREARRPVDRREETTPANGRDVRRPADLPQVSQPPDRRPETDREPAVVPDGGRGRWPDDEAIFGLIQGGGDRTGGLATSGGSRRR